MKRFDLIKLINNKPYTSKNLEINTHGIVINNFNDHLEVLFFNPNNVGDFIITTIKAEDVVLEKEKLPTKVVSELENNLEKMLNKAKISFEEIKIKQYDKVELLVEENRLQSMVFIKEILELLLTILLFKTILK